MKKIHVIMLVASLFLTGCQFLPWDFRHPYVVNAYNKPVELLIVYSNNIPSELHRWLPANGWIAQSQSGVVVQGIKVTDPNGKEITYTTTDFSSARFKRPIKDEVWILSGVGLTLGDESDFHRLTHKSPSGAGAPNE